MTKSIEIGAIALGGASLFAVSFVAFAVRSGQPMDEVPVVGRWFEAPDPERKPGEAPQEREEPRAARRSDGAVIDSTLGVLGAWTLPSPFSVDELRRLTDELEAERFQLADRNRELEAREARLTAENERLAERFATLERMKADLEAYEQDLSLRAAEVARDEGAALEKKEQRWKQLAGVLRELETEEAAELLSEYEPEEAAQVLRELEPTLAAELLGGLRESAGAGSWKAYVDAYSHSAAERAK